MFSRFFIDRPIFATVISVVITLAGFVAVWTLPVAQYPEVTPPTVQVTASYPGANSLTVRDTVAAPIEAQVSGVEGMMYMSSQCTNDGAYNLTVTFKTGMNSDMAQVLVQNRVSLAQPVIPPLVQNQGISVKKMSPNTLMIVNLISPNNQWDSIFLSNYATIYIKDELGRVPGVAGITYLGQRDYSLRAWLDPDKLAALNMTAMDTVTAVAQQNVQVAAGQIGQPPTSAAQQFQLPIQTLGRLTDPEQFADIIAKAGGQSSAAGPMGSGTSASAGATAVATGIVRLSGVVRENRYHFRIRLDASKLARHDLHAEDVAESLRGRNLAVIKDPDAKPEDDALLWQAIITSHELPSVSVLEKAKIVVDNHPDGKLRLADLVASENGIEHLETRDELGVQLGSQQYDQSCTLDGRPSVALCIYQLPGSNAMNTAKEVRAKMEELKVRFPKGVAYDIVYDTTPFIDESVKEVWKTLRDAVILVAVVVLLFLQDWRAMILPMIDVPVSLIGTFAIMAIFGFTLNNLTLFGLVLAIGIVVDDAIVVLENIERQMATGLDARSATIKAMDEITGPILAITLVLTSVFVPCCFLGGLTGQFFRQFAVTIAVSTIISAINAITMTPSRAVMIFQTEEAKGRKSSEAIRAGESPYDQGPGHEHVLLREALPWWIFGLLGFVSYWLLADTIQKNDAEPWKEWMWAGIYFTPGMLAGLFFGWFAIKPVNAVLGAFFQAFNRVFDRMTDGYGKVVGRVLRLSAVVCLVYGGLLVLTVVQFVRAPQGFIPQQDKGYLILSVQLPDAASVERTEKYMAKIDKVVRGDEHDKKRFPGIEGVAHTVGISGNSLILNANAPNFGSMYIMLKPFEERHSAKLSAHAIAEEVQRECQKEVRGAIVSVSGGPPVDGLGTTEGFKFIIEDRGNLGLDELQRISDEVVAQGNLDGSGLRELGNSSRFNTPWLYLEIDRTKCSSLGIALTDVFSTLQIYLGSYYVNNFNEYGRTWQVNLQADQKFRTNVSDILQLQVRNKRGQMVRLGTLMTVKDDEGPMVVMRYNMYSATAITGNQAAGVSSGQAIDKMKEIAREKLPPSMAYEWTELTRLQLDAGYTAMFVFFMGVMFVFLVLAAQYESWSLPLAVILVVPMCLLCSLSTVIMVGMEVSIFTQIGFVVLVGLASKNAILIVEFAKVRSEAGEDPWQATMEASRLRLRPILMTSFAFILGVMPLVAASGAGAEMRRSLGLAVFGGMLGVTMFGIFLTPVFYFVIQRSGGHKPAAHTMDLPDARKN